MAVAAISCLIIAYFAVGTQAVCTQTVVAPKGLRLNTPENIYVNFHDCEGEVVTVAATLSVIPHDVITDIAGVIILNNAHDLSMNQQSQPDAHSCVQSSVINVDIENRRSSDRKCECLSYPEGINQHDQVTRSNRPHQQTPVNVPLQAKSGSIEISQRGNPVYKANLLINFCFGQDCGLANQWKAIDPSTILLNATHGYVFMTTNRPAYRPRETVLISLALTQQNLKLDNANERRPIRIVIKTPEKYGKVIASESAEDKSVDRHGFLEHEYKIPEDPLRGVWWVEAHIDGIKMAEKSFLIDTYELPTFDVKIKPMYHFVLPSFQRMEGEITAEYSYGEKVDGNYYLSFRLVRPDGSEQEFYKLPETFEDEADISRGRETYDVDIQNLKDILRDGESLDDFVDTDARIIIMASVTGFAESVFESDVVDNIIFTRSPFVIDHSQSAKFYIPEKLYELKVTIHDAASMLPLSEIFVTVQWSEDRVRRQRSDENGEIYFLIDTFTEDIETITIKTDSEQFEAADQSQFDLEVRKYQPARTLGMTVQHQFADVGDTQFVRFELGGATPSDIRYFVISRGEIVHAGTKTIDGNQGGEVSSDFKVRASMVPSARVVAYYVHGDEMTSNSAWFDVKNECEKDKELEISSDKDTFEPGETVAITIKGAPNAAVYVSAVDTAAYYVHNGTRLNRDRLWSKMEEYDTGCSRKGGLDALNVFEEAGVTINSRLTPNRDYTNMYCQNSRKKRNAAPSPSSQEVMEGETEICKTCGQRQNLAGLSCSARMSMAGKTLEEQGKSQDHITMCKEKFLTACTEARQGEDGAGLARAVAAGDKANEVRKQVRKNFEESWIFQKRILKANGFDTFNQRATDSITTYQVDAFGMSEDSTMCVAETKRIKIFTEFFIQLYLPYSVRVREQAEIRYSVFNYGEEDARVPVEIRHSSEICSRFDSEAFVPLREITVRGQSSSSGTFTILPLKVPQNRYATIEIRAGKRDHVERKLLIEEPGQHNESSKTIVLQPGEGGAVTEKTLKFDIPKISVMLETKKCYVYLYAHPMGPNVEIDGFNDRLEDLNQYIRQPCGCGEQNMIRIGPIVYVHMYRVSASEDGVTAEQKRQVIAYIQDAYTREINWMSDVVNREAFAVWNHAKPSTWLNAFVTKVFTAASHFWPALDTDPICSALNWLLKMQTRPDAPADQGSFVENYVVHHREMRGLVDEKISLTAYVSISLMESQDACPDLRGRLLQASKRASVYLKQNRDAAAGKPYTLAMGAYALAMSEGKSVEARQWNQMLKDTQSFDGEYIFWQGTRGRAANIETTAYALLAELELNGITEENDADTRNIAYWLISQRNDKGGFISTQDTVVALQALSTYMTKLEAAVTEAPPPTNLDVVITFDDETPDENIDLNPENIMRRREIETPPDQVASAGGITVAVAGVGTGSLAYRCTWRQYADDGKCQFNVEVQVVPDEMSDSDMILKVSVTKPEGAEAQMSIIDVGILTGFKPDEDSIKNLCVEKVVDAAADRYEITDNTVKFYLSKIDADGTTLAFKIRRVNPVSDLQPSSVSAYDYYEPDIRCTKFYNLAGDHQIRSTCDREEKMCKCAEGDCPLCRTRQQQLTETICSNHNEHRRACGKIRGTENTLNLCLVADCYNLHRETCNRDYVYVVQVTEIGDDDVPPGFKYFTAHVIEVFRATARHPAVKGTTVRFLIRNDCFDACKDDDYLNQIARANDRQAKHYITAGRTLLIYGSHPVADDSVNPKRMVYYLTGGGMEITIPNNKCQRLLRKKKKQQDKLNICTIKSILREAHNLGCD